MKKMILIFVFCVALFPAQVFSQMPDLAGVTINTYPVNGQVYMLEASGDVAGNIAVSAGQDGILMVDSQFEPLSDLIKESLSDIQNGGVDYIINTHYHDDHTHGNLKFGKTGTVIGHTNTRELQADRAEFGRPVITFEDSLSIYFNGEKIKLIHFPSSHTGTDVVVFFSGSNVVHMGDLLNSGIWSFPIVDIGSGGSINGLIKTIGTLVEIIPEDALIIPGHYELTNLDGLKKTHTMLLETVGIVRAKMNAGISLEQIQQEGFPKRYDDWGTAYTDANGWIENIYRGLESR